MAEDEISDYYSSLPEEEQELFRNGPIIHSDIYNTYLDAGLIQEIQEGGNVYFDINLADKSYASFLNKDGMLKIGESILQVSDCDTRFLIDAKSIQDLCSENVRVIEFSSQIINLKSATAYPYYYDWSQDKGWSYYDKSWGRYKKRVKVQIIGHSTLSQSNPASSYYCSDYAECTFTLELDAQKRNFWGNYVYTSDFAGPITIEGAYEMEHSSWHRLEDNGCDGCLCGYYSTDETKGYSFPYTCSCAPNPDYICPESPIDLYYPHVNNLSTNVSPHGIFHYSWGDGGYWWSQPIKVYNGELKFTFDGRDYNFIW